MVFIRYRIETIGFDGEKFYSIGMVEVDPKQNIYAFIKLQKGAMKTSRHAPGEYHTVLIPKNGEKTRMGSHKRVPIAKLRGIETINSFGMPINGLRLKGDIQRISIEKSSRYFLY